MTAADCRKILADQISKSSPNPRRSIDTTRLLDSFEEEDRRTAKAAEDALRQQEAQASLRASEQWREEQTAAIRKEIQAEQALERSIAVMRDTRDEQIRNLTGEVKTLREQVATLNSAAATTAAEYKNEVAHLQSELARQQADYESLRAHRDSLAKRLLPETDAEIEEELLALKAELTIATSFDEWRINDRMSLLLHEQIRRLQQRGHETHDGTDEGTEHRL
ncbi:MAG: hypothetical protein WBV41_01020 [Terriglobales bacterium]